ncbi:hypothetical protein [Pedobacter sp. SL55]|uniref:hypothetical protein n=1 Tax=Pedobacter sp. SL55 TaxID=2995161 RepID=UPI002271A6D4|nr:hypothetical protein [Pedobacter sp. SL55]WAC41234.1 hypothetical protein OVA16_02355 [Pedobacter sp. SL55]
MLRNEFKGKTILIAVPDFVGFPEGFKLGLEALGFEAHILLNYEYSKIGFKNTLIHLYNKFALRKKNFKKEKRRQLDYAKQLANFAKSTIDHFDFALFIRPDLFSIELINLVKRKADKLVAYQWDGLDVYPEVYKRIELFERFFVFDVNDLIKYQNVLPITNFYFDNIEISNIDIDAYFVGYYKEDRIESLLLLARKFKNLGLNTSINICVNSSKQISLLKNEPVKILYKQLTFNENITNIARSKILLDVANIVHSGLSMRPFEALGYKKKLITNNALIKEYDFYRPENIFVIQDNNLDGLEQFISTPYKDLPEEIYKKYSFTNWLKYVMDVNPHIPIHFPEKL